MIAPPPRRALVRDAAIGVVLSALAGIIAYLAAGTFERPAPLVEPRTVTALPRPRARPLPADTVDLETELDTRARTLAREGRAALAAGQNNTARSDLLTCIELADLPDCHRSIALLYVNLKDTPSARTHYRRYLELEPDAVDAAEVRRLIDSMAVE